MLQGIIATAPMFACAFWCIALLADVHHRNRAKKVFTLFMFAAFVLYFCHAAFCSWEYDLVKHLDSLYILVHLSVYPLYYLYLRALTDEKPLTWRVIWMFIPALGMSLYTFVLYRLMSAEELMAFLLQVMYKQPGDHVFSFYGELQIWNQRIIPFLFLLTILPVAWQGTRRIVQYNRRLEDYYSNQEGKRLGLMRTMLTFFVICSATSAIFGILGRVSFVQSPQLLLIPSVLFSTLLFMLGLVGFRQDFTVDDFKREASRSFSPDQESAEDYAGKENRQEMQALRDRLIELLEKEELFREPNLRITDLASRLGSNRTYTSRVINQELNTTFSTLINNYRVEYSKQLLSNSAASQLTLQQIAENAGFASDSSFYRIFREATGESPKNWYRKSIV
ncbi:helix-turn-helix transcriptional regulator [Parabacteroides sp. PF5-6]|uniref:helix-turn-helix transcriptional regulator n=1 Tax=Parabacteroides sp. PF5-6 TaxID=1742403 RepID=UPI002406F468|nr:helix-turn-helix transcriptional regulator [Parabacteroides sp. PF5-6]MDF9831507.1 AraC-like DNA-binding protein [Parabacteroides sp. PF5-6]